MALVIGLVTSAMAQKGGYGWKENRHSLSLTVGSPSLISGVSGVFNALFHNNEDQVKIFGTYAVQYNYNALSWLRVGGEFFYSGWNMLSSGSLREHYDEMALMAKLDFTYLNRPYVRLYSGLGMGADFTQLKKLVDGAMERQPVTPNFAWCVTPIGVEAGGRHVYALTEINIGHCDLIRAGIGFRF